MDSGQQTDNTKNISSSEFQWQICRLREKIFLQQVIDGSTRGGSVWDVGSGTQRDNHINFYNKFIAVRRRAYRRADKQSVW
jgi:hypothetical protein